MTKQTAVEWLEDELKADLKKIILEGDSELMESLFEQAKEMEKEQITESYRSGVEDERYEQLKLNGEYYKKNYEKH